MSLTSLGECFQLIIYFCTLRIKKKVLKFKFKKLVFNYGTYSMDFFTDRLYTRPMAPPVDYELVNKLIKFLNLYSTNRKQRRRPKWPSLGGWDIIGKSSNFRSENVLWDSKGIF